MAKQLCEHIMFSRLPSDIEIFKMVNIIYIAPLALLYQHFAHLG